MGFVIVESMRIFQRTRRKEGEMGSQRGGRGFVYEKMLSRKEGRKSEELVW